MILKPFMLRRIKKDVENELSDKIEIMVYCPLTMRQNLLYMALKKKIRIEDLLQFTDRGSDQTTDKNFTSSLMNLVMQFRKVCNHPDLFERRDAKSPFVMKSIDYKIPRLVYDSSTMQTIIPSKNHILLNRFNIFQCENVHRSLFPTDATDSDVEYKSYIDLNAGNAFSFSRFCNLSPQEIANIHHSSTFGQLVRERLMREVLVRLQNNMEWKRSVPLAQLFLEASLSLPILSLIESNSDLLFTRWVSIQTCSCQFRRE